MNSVSVGMFDRYDIAFRWNAIDGHAKTALAYATLGECKVGRIVHSVLEWYFMQMVIFV